MPASREDLTPLIARDDISVILGTSSQWRRMILDELCQEVPGMSYTVEKVCCSRVDAATRAIQRAPNWHLFSGAGTG